MNVILEQRPERLPMARACAVLGLNRSTVYWRRKRAVEARPPRRSRKESVQPRTLSAQEREHIINTLHGAPYRDQPPAEVYQRPPISPCHEQVRRALCQRNSKAMSRSLVVAAARCKPCPEPLLHGCEIYASC